MAGSFGKFELVEPKLLVEACNRGRYPLDWIGQANRFDCSTGHLSGQGGILLLRRDLDKLDLTAEHDLTLGINGDSITLKNLHVAGDTRCLTPGAIDSEIAVHLVPIGDRRRLWQFAAMNRAYNLRLTPNGEYVESTATDSATPYTWAEVWSNLKGLLPGGISTSIEGLPYTPDGSPENLAYWGWTVGDAVGHFLSRLGCAIAWNPITDTYTVVRLGATQSGLAAAEKKLAKDRRLRSLEPVTGVIGVVPASVQVLFTKSPGPRAYGQSPYFAIEVDNGDAQDGDTGVMMIKDDMLAKYSATTLQNLSDLQTRADERATEFFRVRRNYVTEPHRKTYSGIVDSIMPGSEIATVAWGDIGQGTITETRRITYRDPVQKWPSIEHQAWRLTEWVRIKTSIGSGPTDEYQDARIVVWNSEDNQWEEIAQCWWKGANSEAGIEGWRYLSRFKDHYNGRPVYVGGCCEGTEAPEVDVDDDFQDYEDDIYVSPPSCTEFAGWTVLSSVTASNKTGAATCLDNSLELVSGGFNTEPAGGGAPTCSGNVTFTVDCSDGEWGIVSATCVGVFWTLVSWDADVGVMVYDVNFGTCLDTLGVSIGTARLTLQFA